MAFATPLQSLFIKRRNFVRNRFRFQPTNESQHMFQSIMKIRRPFLTDDLCLKVALMLNYVPVTQNTLISDKKWAEFCLEIPRDKKFIFASLTKWWMFIWISIKLFTHFIELLSSNNYTNILRVVWTSEKRKIWLIKDCSNETKSKFFHSIYRSVDLKTFSYPCILHWKSFN